MKLPSHLNKRRNIGHGKGDSLASCVLRTSRRLLAGFTLVEVIVISLVLVALAGLVLPKLRRPRVNHGYVRCINNLKQIGLAFQMYADDHGGKYPMALPKAQGGTADAIGTTHVFLHFQAISNYLSDTKVLVCRCDTKRMRAASNWAELRNSDIDYWVGVDAQLSNSASLVAGEKFIQTHAFSTNNLMVLRPYTQVYWSNSPIVDYGNVVFADNRVERFPSADWPKWLKKSGQGIIRLAVP